MFGLHGSFLTYAMHHHRETIKLTHYGETKKGAHVSQIVRAKKKLKFSHGGPKQWLASATNTTVKVLGQGPHWVWGLIYCHAIKEETITINSEYDQEIPRSQTADNPVAPRGKPLNHHETPGRQIKQSNQLSLPQQDDCNTRMDIK